MFFSFIIVTLNPGFQRLRDTIVSLCCKNGSFKRDFEYEILIKDGGSTDGSIEALKEYLKGASLQIRYLIRPDTGIYDAMNQALTEAAGDYVYFLNTGDELATLDVPEKIKALIDQNPGRGIYYGNVYDCQTCQPVPSNPKIDAFACYRNVPCHQACFYERELIRKHPFETKYRVRADYEQFLWCFFEGGANPLHIDMDVANYEGAGFSETKENLKKSAREHREIVGKYMPLGQIVRYRMIMILTLAPLRTALSHNKKTAAIYNGLKRKLYGRKQ